MKVSWSIIFSILITLTSCVSQHELIGDYKMYGDGLVIMQIRPDSMILIPYYSVGEGYDILMGTYTLRGKRLICRLDYYQMRPGFPQAKWEKGNICKYKYKVLPSGDLANPKLPNEIYKLPNEIYKRTDSLSESQVKLLEMASSLVRKNPYK